MESRCSATTAPRSRSCATCPGSSARLLRESRRRCASGSAQAPSFVAFEGYDTVTILADVLRSCDGDRARVAESWSRLACRRHPRADPVFPRGGHRRLAMGLVLVQVVDRDPAESGRFRVLRAR